MLIPAGFVTRLARRLTNLAGEYADRLGERRAHVLLKRDHTLRVHALAAHIARAEAPDMALLCRAAALMHDIGRFEQFERFGTFRDDESVDHGDLGAKILERENFLAECGPAARNVVISAVRLHNKRELPARLEEPLGTVVRVVRDADKLDIVPLVLAGMEPGRAGDKVVALGLADTPGAWNPHVLETVRRGGNPAYADLTCANDFRLLLASWGPGLEFTASRSVFRRRDYLGRIFAQLPDMPEFSALRAVLVSRL